MNIRHGAGEYAVDFQPLAGALASIPSGSAIVTDQNVERLYGHLIPAGARILSVPAGEPSKSFDTYRQLLERMADSRSSRKTSVVALGGGVIGDLAGFVAATYMRGVPLIQIPTTLLSQVDSSVGGKVGIDMPQGKNLVGAFYPPVRVAVPIDALSTLDRRQFDNGMAEVWKYVFIADPSLADDLAPEGLDRDVERLERIVRRCIEIKAGIVESDELETSGLRATLNFGHTIGHAIEHLSGYGPVLHGEAISIGMAVEALLGERLGVTESGAAAEVRRSLEAQGLPTRSELLARPDALMDAMRRDKKATDGALAFSLLTRIGGCRLVQSVPEQEVLAALTTT